MDLGIVFLVGMVAILAAFRLSSLWPSLFVGALLLAAMFPRTLVLLENGSPRANVADIAGSAPALTTTSVVIFSMLLLTSTSRRSARTLAFVGPFFLYAAFAYILLWDRSSDVRAGLLSLFAALAAWVVGARIGQSGIGSFRQMRLLAWFVAAMFSVELLAAMSQLSNVVRLDGRPTGSYGHPSWLGKVVLAVLPILLPFTSSADKGLARPARIALLCGLAATALTMSRANTLAVLGVSLAWVLIMRRAASAQPRLFGRLGAAVALGLATLPFIGGLLARFDIDPDGGDRPELLAAGLRVTSEYLWTGTGPNNFVLVARIGEPIVRSTGYPVHNSIILGVASLGLVGAFLFALPLLNTAILAIRSRSDADFWRANLARAYLLGLTGVVFVGLSGWGWWQDPALHLVYFVAGVFRSGLTRSSPDSRSIQMPADQSPCQDVHSELRMSNQIPSGRSGALGRRSILGRLAGAHEQVGGGYPFLAKPASGRLDVLLPSVRAFEWLSKARGLSIRFPVSWRPRQVGGWQCAT